VTINLTPAGKKLIAELFPHHAHNIFRMMGVLSDAELELLGSLSKKLGLGARKKMTI
jgi:DNA-binding MarR family transcriptional regulator